MNKSSTKNVIRIIAVVILVLIAAFVSFFLLPKLYKLEGATANVVLLRADVEMGDQITEDMIIQREIGSYALDPSIITDPTDVIGRYAVCDISSKDLLFPEKFSSENPKGTKTEDLEVELSQDQMLLTLQLHSTAAGAAGNILPGDRVYTAVYSEDFYSDEKEHKEELGVIDTENTDGANPLDPEGLYGTPEKIINMYGDRVRFPAELQDLIVYRVLTANLTGVDPECDPNASATNDRIPAYITLICTQEQADMLLDYNYTNIVHFLEEK